MKIKTPNSNAPSPDLPSASAPRAEPPTQIRWRILAILFVVSFIAYIVRLNLSIAGISIRDDLGLTDTQLSFVLSAFIYAYALFQFPGGLFGQYFGARRALTYMLIGWAVVTALTGILPGLAVGSTTSVIALLFVMRFALGVVQAPLFPVMASSIVAWFPVGRWALPNSVCSVGAVLGAAVTPVLIAWLTLHFGWRAAFWLTAPLSLFACALWWWYSRDTPDAHAAVNSAELAMIRENKGVAAGKRLPPGLIGRLLRNRQILLLMTAYFCMNYVWYIYFSWLFIYLVEERGFSMLESGFLAALPWLAGGVAVAAGGETCDRLCQRIGPRWGCRIPAIVGLVGAAFALSAGALAPNPYVAVGLLTLCYAANQFTEGAFWQGTSYVGRGYTAAATGMLNTGGNLAGIVATTLTAVLFQNFGWLVAFGTGSVLALIGAVLWLWIRVDEPIEAA